MRSPDGSRKFERLNDVHAYGGDPDSNRIRLIHSEVLNQSAYVSRSCSREPGCG